MDEDQAAKLEALYRAVFGERGDNGILGDMNNVKRELFYDPNTRKAGLSEKVDDLTRTVNGVRFWLKGLVTAISIGVVSGTAMVVRQFFGL